MYRDEIPEKMKAMVLTGPGTWEIREEKIPQLGDEEVLCKIGGVAICGSDPEVLHGGLAGIWPPSYPFIAGHEWAGRIVAKGKGVTKFEIGDRVAGEAHKGCGHCINCLQGRYTLCLNYGKTETGHRHYGFVHNGAYAQYAVYHIKSLTKLPENVSYREAAMCDTAGVALHGIELAGIEPGCTVAIIGPGPIGIMATKLAKAMGAAKVIVVGRPPRLDAATKLGADLTVDFTTCDPVKKVHELTNGLGVSVAFECSGAPGTINECIKMCKKGGKVVMLGVAKEGMTESIPLKYTTHNEISILGSRANPNVSYKVIDLISSGRINVKDMVTHTFSLDEIEQAFHTFENRIDGAMKVVIYPNGGEDV